jgi:hypothetical protein
MATNQESFKTNIELELKFADTIKQILGLFFFRKDINADLNEATDFMVMRADGIRIGIRLRKYKYWKNSKYRNQFTIRWKLKSGHETEIDKIYEGLVDYIFYGFVDKKQANIVQYIIADLGVFRGIAPDPIEVKANKDGRSDLAAFDIKQFPSEFILKAWSLENGDVTPK